MDLNITSLLATSGLLLALGFRHGLDPDHIAVVDGMTRLRHNGSAYWKARLTGFQFAAGHSLTIFAGHLCVLSLWGSVATMVGCRGSLDFNVFLVVAGLPKFQVLLFRD